MSTLYIDIEYWTFPLFCTMNVYHVHRWILDVHLILYSEYRCCFFDIGSNIKLNLTVICLKCTVFASTSHRIPGDAPRCNTHVPCIQCVELGRMWYSTLWLVSPMDTTIMNYIHSLKQENHLKISHSEY